jgi:hypothetical protein
MFLNFIWDFTFPSEGEERERERERERALGWEQPLEKLVNTSLVSLFGSLVLVLVYQLYRHTKRGGGKGEKSSGR